MSYNEIDLSLIDKIFRVPSLFSKFSIKAFGVERSVETIQTNEQKKIISDLDAFQKNVNQLLASSLIKRIVILIDKVDDIWHQTEESEMMIKGLI